uniref:Uncharacterized protein n=1 Tax=Lotharella globosa TaxID=91324 RepID=A0A7S4DNA2_9EUKA|mmetsp:Transcript_9957/g.19666  ORF Transcript_9957/g.19666 Transcript_9957/m.19666 type:complete len:152 (+) Transcript_9957:14-469(+)
MADKPKSSGAGVYGKRIAGSGAGEVLTRVTGEKVKVATDDECRLRVQELMSDLKNSNKRLTLEEFQKKHKSTMDDMNMMDNPESRAAYRRQLDAERRKRMKQMKKRRKDDKKLKKKKKKEKKEKKMMSKGTTRTQPSTMQSNTKRKGKKRK